MLPEFNIPMVQEEEMPSFTYNIDIENKTIIGNVDGLDAIRQSIMLILLVERYESLIFNWHYGFEGDTLIGQNRDYVQSELPRRITDALMEDDRILSVSDFSYHYGTNFVHVEFFVQTTGGVINSSVEVTL